MFSTKIGGSRFGINIAIGAAGSEQSFIPDQVIKDAKQRGWSTKKNYNWLDRTGNDYLAQVVSYYNYKILPNPNDPFRMF